MLSCDRITQRINGVTVLEETSIEINPGSITVLLGPNGAGKSVLLRALAMIDPPSSGVIRVDDDTYTFPQDNGRQLHPWPRITIVFQQLFLWPHLSLLDNITIACRKQRHDKANFDSRLADLIELFDLTDAVKRFPNEVSGGQRQRAALVRAAILEPRWLLLDEPTSSQDLEQIQRFIDYCHRLKDRGVGLVIATHLLGLAAKLGDQIVFLDRGRVVEHGDASMIAKPKSERLKRFVELLEYVSNNTRRSHASSGGPA